MMFEEKWDDFIDGIEEETFPTKVRLSSKQYLSDVLDTFTERCYHKEV